MDPCNDEPGPALSVLEFEQLPEDDRYRQELVRGRVLREPRPAPLHGRILARLSHLLYEATEGSGKFVLLSDAGFVLEDDPPTVRGPDLAVVRRERVPPSGYAPGFWHIAPDIAIEIISPSNRASQMQDKVLQYLEAGVPIVWIVDPGTSSIIVHFAGGRSQLLTMRDTIDGGEILPDFTLKLATLFQL